jgi:hypothetical protein
MSQKKISDAELELLGIRRIDKDLRTLTRSQLAKYFSAETSGRILLTSLIKNIIWQAYELIQSGKEPTIDGNIRTFWYRWVKPVLAHISDDDKSKTDPYDVMVTLLSDMVLDLKLFSYSDFDFSDENWENRRIGASKPHILVFAEKSGWMRFLRQIHTDFGVSVIALGGMPSALTSEYTSRDISPKLLSPKFVHLIGIVDYDPAGDIIANAFKEQLTSTGLSIASLTTLIHPSYYTKEELSIFRFPLPKKDKTKVNNWLSRTGGIEGKPFGLESESMPSKILYTLIQQRISVFS